MEFDKYKNYSDKYLRQIFKEQDQDPCILTIDPYHSTEPDDRRRIIHNIQMHCAEFHRLFGFKLDCEKCEYSTINTFEKRFKNAKKYRQIVIPEKLKIPSTKESLQSLNKKVKSCLNASNNIRFEQNKNNETITADDMKDIFQEALNDMED